MSHAYETDNRGPVIVVDRKGKVVVRSPEYWGEEGLAWSSDGAAVLFAASDGGSDYVVRALTMDGKVREVLADPSGIIVHDTHPGGRLLVSGQNERALIVARFPGSAVERELTWLEMSFFPVMSADGRKVLFSDQSQQAGPNYSVYMRAADDLPPVRLGEGFPVDFSPNGASVLAVVPSKPPRLMIYPTGAGAPRDVSAAGFESYDFFSTRFARKGLDVMFCGSETGKPSRCYVRDLAGGDARALTPEGTDRGVISPDGRTVLARGNDGRYQIYPADGGQPTPVAGLEAFDIIVGFRADGRSLLVYRPLEMPIRIESLDLATGRRTRVRDLAPVDRTGAVASYGLDFSADENAYVYCLDRSLGALYSVMGVR